MNEEVQAPIFDDAFRAQLAALLTWRRDVRRFRRDPLPDGLLDSLIASAALAPSVGNAQPWRFMRLCCKVGRFDRAFPDERFKGPSLRGGCDTWAVRWYCRYGVSYRDLEAMLGERGGSFNGAI